MRSAAADDAAVIESSWRAGALTWLTGLAAVWLLWRPASSAFFKPQALNSNSAVPAGDADRRH